jgi:hypothetical protein
MDVSEILLSLYVFLPKSIKSVIRYIHKIYEVAMSSVIVGSAKSILYLDQT